MDRPKMLNCLFTLLNHRIPDPVRLKEVFGIIGPFYKYAENKRFWLRKRNGIDSKEVAEALQKATGQGLPDFAFISATMPFTQPEWMSGLVYQETVSAVFRELTSLAKTHVDALIRTSHSQIAAEIPSPVFSNLADQMARLEQELTESFQIKSLCLASTLARITRTTIEYFLVYEIRNRKNGGNPLEHLVLVSQARIPMMQLNEKWLVVTG